MAGLRPGQTLFDVVPALGALSAHGGGAAKLMPVGFDHPALELIEGLNRVGRDPAQNHHVVSSSHISRCHCEILFNDGQIWVKDLGSHNGTYVNGERVTEHELHPGDELGLSRRVTFVLAMDQDMEQPIDVEVEMDAVETKVSLIRPGPPPIPPPAAGHHDSLRVATTPGGDPSPPVPPPEPDAVPDQAALLKQVEQQRNVLAILYQISLRCLMASDQQEIEQLITNVLRRLVPMEAGFILYKVAEGWRASICPSSSYRPADATVKAFYKLASVHGDAVVVDAPDQLARLGVKGGSAMLVPMIQGDNLHGVVGTISDRKGVYTEEIVDIMKQLANVSAAALRER